MGVYFYAFSSGKEAIAMLLREAEDCRNPDVHEFHPSSQHYSVGYKSTDPSKFSERLGIEGVLFSDVDRWIWYTATTDQFPSYPYPPANH